MMRRLMAVVMVMMALAAGRSGFGGGGGFGGGAGGFGGGSGGGGFGGGGGLGNMDPDVAQQLIQNINMDPDMMQQIQGMMQIGGQVMQNIQDAGDDPATVIQAVQQQMQDGTIDFDTLQKQMIDKGYMSQDMVQQMQTIMGQMQGSVQKLLVNTTYSRIKQLLNPTEEEWAILMPRVKRVLDLQAEVAQGGDTMNKENGVLGVGGIGGGMGAMGRGMGFATQVAGPQGSNTDLGKAWKRLQAAVEDRRIGDDALRLKLQEWRVLHERARAELKAAQDDVVNILTLRQESVMLLVGVL